MLNLWAGEVGELVCNCNFVRGPQIFRASLYLREVCFIVMFPSGAPRLARPPRPGPCLDFRFQYAHSTTTWTNFDPILTPSPPRVDKRGLLHTPPVHVDNTVGNIFPLDPILRQKIQNLAQIIHLY